MVGTGMSEQGKILIADKEIFVKTLIALLEPVGYTCSWAPDVATVKALLNQDSFTYDVLIAEIKMAGNSNLELIHDVARLAPGLPVILMTGSPSLESAIHSIQLPVVAYLIKPFGIDVLLAEIRNALTQFEAYRVIQEAQRRWQMWGKALEQLASVIGKLRPDPLVTKEVVAGSVSGLFIDYVKELLYNPVSLGHQVSQPSVPLLQGTVELQEAGLRGSASTGQTFPPELLSALRRLSRREREVLRLLLANQRPQVIARHLFISPYTVRNHRQAIFNKLNVHSQTELVFRFGPYLWNE
jgi:DNA-binding NarL/FixJ family response regulator